MRRSFSLLGEEHLKQDHPHLFDEDGVLIWGYL